jgi:hypothetical protein
MQLFKISPAVTECHEEEHGPVCDPSFQGFKTSEVDRRTIAQDVSNDRRLEFTNGWNRSKERKRVFYMMSID